MHIVVTNITTIKSVHSQLKIVLVGDIIELFFSFTQTQTARLGGGGTWWLNG